MLIIFRKKIKKLASTEIVQQTHICVFIKSTLNPSHERRMIHSQYLCMQRRFSCVPLSVTPWTVAPQAPLSRGFSRQKYWSGFPCPPPRGSFRPRDQTSLTSPVWQADSLLRCHLGSPFNTYRLENDAYFQHWNQGVFWLKTDSTFSYPVCSQYLYYVKVLFVL